MQKLRLEIKAVEIKFFADKQVKKKKNNFFYSLYKHPLLERRKNNKKRQNNIIKKRRNNVYFKSIRFDFNIKSVCCFHEILLRD